LIKWKLISFIKLTLEQIKNKKLQNRERIERELRRENGEREEGCRSTKPFFSTNKYVFVSNKFEIHLLIQGMTGFLIVRE
jgi:CRISPR/Cas system-associated protein Cas5 (RAMP superfamily)